MNPPGHAESRLDQSCREKHRLAHRRCQRQRSPLRRSRRVPRQGRQHHARLLEQREATQEGHARRLVSTRATSRAEEKEGYIYIIDRLKDMIISMGENIYPREVEELIYQFPGVAELLIIGIEDKLRGQAGAALLQPARGASINIRELKIPPRPISLSTDSREFHELPSLPRTATGKDRQASILKEFMDRRR